MLVANVCVLSVHGPYIWDMAEIWVFLTRRSICSFLRLKEVLKDDYFLPSVFCKQIREYHKNSNND
jgi:hypothetical protein